MYCTQVMGYNQWKAAVNAEINLDSTKRMEFLDMI